MEEKKNNEQNRREDMTKKTKLLEITSTLRYSIYKVAEEVHSVENNLSARQFQCDYSIVKIDEIKERYQKYGFCIYRNLFSQQYLIETKKKIDVIAKELIRNYDSIEDEFVDFDKEENNIVRMPRIGRGKHNIHFDPEFSEQHEILYEMISNAGVLDILSAVSGGTCTLRETGISITRPLLNKFGTELSGEGIEWHSDGAKGEFTMLLGLDDVSNDMGALRIVPGSHLEYVDGIGHDEVRNVSICVDSNIIYFLF